MWFLVGYEASTIILTENNEKCFIELHVNSELMERNYSFENSVDINIINAVYRISRDHLHCQKMASKIYQEKIFIGDSKDISVL